MKPFRGKPEKPERSNGEIQRVSSRPGVLNARDGHGPRSDVIAPFFARCVGVAYACTSPLVGRRDPLGAGLRIGVETEWRLRAVSVRTPVSRPARPTV